MKSYKSKPPNNSYPFILDCTPSNCCKSSTNPAWEESWSSGLSSSQQTHWKLLGWDQSSWDGDKYNAATQKICYSALSTDQVNAVKSLCYDQSKWDAYMLSQYQATCGKYLYFLSFCPYVIFD